MAIETLTQELLDRINAGCKPIHLTPGKTEMGQAFTKVLWEETNLAPLVKMQLTDVDEAFKGLCAVTDLLTVDALNRNDAADSANVTFEPLPGLALDGLRYAQSALLGRIGDALEEIKERCHVETQA